MLGPGGPVSHLETGLKEPQQKNLLKSNECLIPKLGNHVGYVNSPTRKGGLISFTSKPVATIKLVRTHGGFCEKFNLLFLTE